MPEDTKTRRQRIREEVDKSFGKVDEDGTQERTNDVQRVVEEGTSGYLGRAMRYMSGRRRQLEEAERRALGAD